MIMNRRRLLQSAALGLVLGYGLEIDVLAAERDPSAERPPLAPDQLAVLAALADTIIPRTQTPGAVDVGVPEFIRFMVYRGMHEDVRRAFDAGLEAFQEDALGRLGTRFETAGAERRHYYVDAIDGEIFLGDAAAPKRKALLDFYATVKKLTVIGYYTSERGARAELAVEFYPGPFDGSVPMDARTRTFYEDAFGVPLVRSPGYLPRDE